MAFFFFQIMHPIHETKMADISPFTVEERLVTVAWCHERRNTKMMKSHMDALDV